MQNDYDLGMKWNDRLAQARDAAGVIDSDIARYCRVSPATVNGWMTGKTVNIEARHLFPVCRILKVSPFWVMGESEFDYEVNAIPEDEKIGAVDALRLIGGFSQTNEMGRQRILDSVEEAKRSFPLDRIADKDGDR